MSSDEGKDPILVKVLVDDSTVEKDAAVAGGKVEKGIRRALGDFKLINVDNIVEESGSSLEGITGRFGRMGLAGAAAAAVVYGLKKALDFGVEGEHIKAINAQFDNLAGSAGLIPEQLKASLEEAGDGLVNMENLLGRSSSAILNLGASASRLPEILELSRKQAALLGGTLEDRFAGLIGAIESGSEKALKSQGIYIDVDSALRKYAASLGLATGDLTQAQKQQALLNAALDEGAKKVAGVNASIQPATDNIQRFKVGFGNLVDRMAVSLGQSGVFAKFADILGDIGRPLPNNNGLATDAARMIAERMALEASIERLKEKISQSSGARQANFKGLMADYETQLASLRSEISKTGVKIVSVNSETIASDQKAEESAKKKAEADAKREARKLSAQQQALIMARKLALVDVENQRRLAENSQLQSNTSLETNPFEQNLKRREIFQAREALMKTDHDNKMKALEAQNQAGSFQTEQDYLARKATLNNAYALGLQEIRSQQAGLAQELPDSIRDGSYAIESMFGDLSEEARNYRFTVEESAKAIRQSLKNIAKEAFNSLGQGVGKGFAAFGETLVNGGNSLDAFTNAFLKSVGEMAVASGTRFIMEGIAWMFVPGMQGVGGAMVAAGATLAAFGGALGAIMANSAPNRGGGGYSGGGIDSSETGTTSVVNPENLERKDPKTSIAINIQGDVFDTPATGMRIADLLNEEFAMRGVVIRSAV